MVVITIKATVTYCSMKCNLKAMFASFPLFGFEDVLNLITFVIITFGHVKSLWTELHVNDCI